MPALTGSCLCGAVHLTLKDPAPVLAYGLEVCHCTDCRQFTGALAGAFLNAESANLSVDNPDNVASYATQVESGNTLTRHWCRSCGSSLYDATSRDGGKTLVAHGGHFKPGSLPKPSGEFWMRSAEEWEVPAAGVEVHQTQPPYE